MKILQKMPTNPCSSSEIFEEQGSQLLNSHFIISWDHSWAHNRNCIQSVISFPQTLHLFDAELSVTHAETYQPGF